MTGGNIKDFIDGLYYGNEMLTEYKSRRYNDTRMVEK